MKDYKIFISSTYKELSNEREKVISAIEQMGYQRVNMEMFNAASKSPWEYIKEQMKKCNLYLLILGSDYGTVESENKSYTHMEFELAKEMNLPILSFIKGNNKGKWAEYTGDEKYKKQFEEFRKDVTDKQIVATWSDECDLSVKVCCAIHEHAIKDIVNNLALDLSKIKTWISETSADFAEVMYYIKNESEIQSPRYEHISFWIGERDQNCNQDIENLSVETNVSDDEKTMRVSIKRKGFFIGNTGKSCSKKVYKGLSMFWEFKIIDENNTAYYFEAEQQINEKRPYKTHPAFCRLKKIQPQK